MEFNWVTLINKIIQISGVQFYKTSSVYFIVCSPPQVKSPSITIYPTFTLLTLLTPLPSGNHHTVVCVWLLLFLVFCFALLNPLTFFNQPPKPLTSDICQSVLCIYVSVAILFVSLCCSLDFTYT